MQPKLKNRYLIFTGFDNEWQAMCIRFHSYPDTETHDGIPLYGKYQTADLDDIIDGFSLVSMFLATKPELKKCYQYYQKHCPILVKGLKADTHPASKKLIKKIVHDADYLTVHDD